MGYCHTVTTVTHGERKKWPWNLADTKIMSTFVVPWRVPKRAYNTDNEEVRMQ